MATASFHKSGENFKAWAERLIFPLNYAMFSHRSFMWFLCGFDTKFSIFLFSPRVTAFFRKGHLLMNAVQSLFSKAKAFLSSHKKVRLLLIIALVILVLVLALHPHGTKTFLILGIDNYGSLDENGRSDVIMLVQVNFDRTRISAVTFARDMFIENENNRLTKINTIVRTQDEDALVQAVERNFGVSIDGWFRVNFTTLIEVVDAIGGAQVEITEAEAAYIGKIVGYYDDYPLSEGVCRLNGAQALAYARCRKLDNDLGRGERQSKLLAAMVQQTRHLTIANVVSVYNSLNHAWRSSLSSSEQVRLVAQALWLRGAKVDRIGVPFEGHWRYGNTSGGDSGIILNIEENRDLLLEALGLPAVADATPEP